MPAMLARNAVITTRRRDLRGSGAVLAFLLLVLLPILYFLSLGPAILLVNQGVVNEDTLEIVYFPVILVYDVMPPLQAPIDWYIRLWHG